MKHKSFIFLLTTAWIGIFTADNIAGIQELYVKWNYRKLQECRRSASCTCTILNVKLVIYNEHRFLSEVAGLIMNSVV